LEALSAVNYSATVIIESTINYLIANQNTDGGFGLAGKLSLADVTAKESNVYITSLALLTLNQYRKDYYLEEIIIKALDWLISQQNEDGSFGISLYETALAYSALIRCQMADGR
jgi:prenyltransferase beta subunit